MLRHVPGASHCFSAFMTSVAGREYNRKEAMSMTDTRRFDRVAATWDEDPARVALASAVAEAIGRQVQLGSTMDVLDFGCGTGLLTAALLPRVGRVTGADTSTGMLTVLERKAREQALKSVTTLLLRPDDNYALAGEYDLIVSSMTLHHVADPAALFARFREHLRPGGRVAVADLDREDGTFHKPEITDVFHLGFDRAAVKAMLAAAGFGELVDTTAFVARRNDRDYPVFLISGRLGSVPDRG
jgi:tRNA (cmo5U34)-methyltransferase